jgi:hypothetical protein
MRMQRKLQTAVIAAVAAGAIGGCGGQTKVSSRSLQSRLAPASVAPGFTLLRTLDWSDPVNLVGEGFGLPERTHPSQGVQEVRSVGFEGAAGEQLNQGGPMGQTINSGVVRLDSAANANKLRSWMHSEDLQQPCFAQCIFSPRNMAIPGVPGATAVQQVSIGVPPPPPLPPPAFRRRLAGRRFVVPPTAGAPSHYLAEFTIGPYLYFVATFATGGRSQFVAGVKQYYDIVKRMPS